MARWTQTWLSGLGAAGVDRHAEGSWPGRRYGLPEHGPGAVATTGSRVAALLVDVLAGALIGRLVVGLVDDPSFLVRTLVVDGSLVLQVILLQALTGQSLGMRLIGIRVARVSAPDAVPGFVAATIRTALLVLVLPALLMDRDGRGLHDKAAGTVVLRGASGLARSRRGTRVGIGPFGMGSACAPIALNLRSSSLTVLGLMLRGSLRKCFSSWRSPTCPSPSPTTTS